MPEATWRTSEPAPRIVVASVQTYLRFAELDGVADHRSGRSPTAT
ncbi:hypothetical protein ACIBL3_16150 [Kribbella sp. NPDC050124]